MDGQQGQQNPQQYRQPQAPQQYPQQAPQQYPQQAPRTYQQYQQQMYRQYPQYQPAQRPQPVAVPPPEKKVPIKLIGIIVGIVAVIVVAMLFIRLLPEKEKVKEEVLMEQTTEIRPQIMFDSNNFVFSDSIMLPRVSNVYDVGDDVYLYSVFKDFDQAETPEGKHKVELSYGISVMEPDNYVIEDLSSSNVAIINQEFDDRVPDYYFTAGIPTGILSEGFYIVNVTGRDRLSGKTVSKNLELELREPLQLKVANLQLGEFDPIDETFEEKDIRYKNGDVIQSFFEIRGFDVVNNAPFVDVDMYITDSDGLIIQDVSQKSVYVNNRSYLTKPVLFQVNVNTPIEDLDPGTYNFQILAKDRVAKETSLRKREFVVV